MIFKYSTDFFFYPPITANLDFYILFHVPELSEQTLLHQFLDFDILFQPTRALRITMRNIAKRSLQSLYYSEIQ